MPPRSPAHIPALQEQHHAVRVQIGRGKPQSSASGASARAETTSACRPPSSAHAPRSARRRRSHWRPVSRIAARRNAAFFAFDSTSVKCRAGLLLAGDRDDEPGKPCPASEIDPFAKVGRRMVEELQAVGDMPRPDIVERRCARRDCASRCHSRSSATKRSRSCFDRRRDEAESIERGRRRRIMPRRGQQGRACV